MERRPNLSDVELDRIAELTEEKRLSPRQIARSIGCSIGSVTWAQLRIGADKYPDKEMPDVPMERPIYRRHGKEVLGFNQSDDAALLALEKEGHCYGEIGRRMIPPRRPNSIHGRLMTLSRRTARAEARARSMIRPRTPEDGKAIVTPEQAKRHVTPKPAIVTPETKIPTTPETGRVVTRRKGTP